MRIKVETLITDKQIKDARFKLNLAICRELAIKVSEDVLSKEASLYYKLDGSNELGIIKKYVMEMIVFNKDSLKSKLHKFQDKFQLSDQAMKELWHDLMSTY